MEELINRIISKLVKISGLNSGFAKERVERIEWVTDTIIQQLNEKLDEKD